MYITTHSITHTSIQTQIKINTAFEHVVKRTDVNMLQKEFKNFLLEHFHHQKESSASKLHAWLMPYELALRKTPQSEKSRSSSLRI